MAKNEKTTETVTTERMTPERAEHLVFVLRHFLKLGKPLPPGPAWEEFIAEFERARAVEVKS